jgi:uncharacterized LabA/DUF88 family protein
MAEKVRVRIFVDFWNFQINWNDYHVKNGSATLVPIPWKELPAVLVAEAAKGQAAKFAGIHVYASVNSASEKDRKLNSWLHHTMAGFTGYIVDVRERKPRKAIRCQEENCKTPITTCPNCRAPLRGTVEKGVDAAIITDLITLASDDNYDLAVLISGDADYAPAVRFIQRKTDKQVVQAFFKAHGDELRNACWDHIFFDDLMPKLLPAPTAKPSVTA